MQCDSVARVALDVFFCLTFSHDPSAAGFVVLCRFLRHDPMISNDCVLERSGLKHRNLKGMFKERYSHIICFIEKSFQMCYADP